MDGVYNVRGRHCAVVAAGTGGAPGAAVTRADGASDMGMIAKSMQSIVRR